MLLENLHDYSCYFQACSYLHCVFLDSDTIVSRLNPSASLLTGLTRTYLIAIPFRSSTWTVYVSHELPPQKFCMISLYPPSLALRWTHYVPPERRYQPAGPHGVTTEKAATSFWNLNKYGVRKWTALL